MSRPALLAPTVIESAAPAPAPLPFFGAAVAGLLTLLISQWLGRNVESAGGRLLVFAVSLMLATLVALVVLVATGAISLDVVQKIG